MAFLTEIYAHPDYLLLLFLRVSGLLIGSPIFGRKNVPNMIKIAFCFTLTAVFFTALPAPAVYPAWTSVIEYTLLCLRELLFGLAMQKYREEKNQKTERQRSGSVTPLARSRMEEE